jgi:hypothetical protein
MKACDSCVSNRVEIGKNYKKMPVWVRAIGMVFIYLPILKRVSLVLPFIDDGCERCKNIKRLFTSA